MADDARAMLQQVVVKLSEEQARAVMALLDAYALVAWGVDIWPLSDDECASIAEAMAEIARGEVIPWDEVKQKYGLGDGRESGESGDSGEAGPFPSPELMALFQQMAHVIADAGAEAKVLMGSAYSDR